jgi:biotin synthase
MQVFHRSESTQAPQFTKAELRRLLQVKGEAQQQLFQQARQARRQHQTDKVLLRGVIEVSNHCQKNCNYCAMRASYKELERYRLSAEQLFEIATTIRETNLISTIFFQGGQDPQYDAVLQDVIPQIRKHLGLNILLCLGERPREVYERFAELGADSYILKFETADPQLYQEIAHTPLSRRIQCIRWLQELGYQVGTGNIVGLPNQTLDTLVEDIWLALQLQPDFVSSSPFIPNPNTPLEQLSFGDIDLTLNTMAIYRIAFPKALVPTVSALEKIQKDGQLMGLNAGANVFTINFTPEQARSKYVIYSKQRFVVSLEHALKTVERAGLQILPPPTSRSTSDSAIN